MTRGLLIKRLLGGEEDLLETCKSSSILYCSGVVFQWMYGKQKHTDKSNRVSDGKVVSDVPQASGEGSPSTEQIDLTKSKEYKVGETINIASDGKEYELLIEKAEYTEKRDEYTQDPSM